MATTGTTTIDFGTKATDTSVAVSQAAITSTSLVEAWVLPSASSSNTLDDHWVSDVRVLAGNVQSGSGFTIYAAVNEGLAHGVYNVGWVYT